MSSFYVWRNIKQSDGTFKREIVVTNLKYNTDIDPTEEELEQYKADGIKLEKRTMIQMQLAEIDNKRIRALLEGGVRESDGKPWLDVYNEEAAKLRLELTKIG